MSSSTPLKTFSICSSSSVRSVMISTRASVDVLADPLGQPDHGQALAAALGVPDDAALALARRAPGRPCTPKYWLWRQIFLMPASKTMKSWIDLQQALLARRAGSGAGRAGSRRRRRCLLLPGQAVLLRRLDHAVAQALGVVAGHHELHGGEEGLDERPSSGCRGSGGCPRSPRRWSASVPARPARCR